MRILHTADWHLGRNLHGYSRHAEFEQFLDWLSQAIDAQKIDALLIAGDVFDTNTPSNNAQNLYYRFLYRMATSSCRHVIIIAGNHDSPSFLNAPKNLLEEFNIHVIGAMSDDLQDEIITLYDDMLQPQAIICAVPYLRDKDIRTAQAGETISDKSEKLLQGLRQHYQEVCKLAQQQRQDLQKQLPIIAMGHLFTKDGKVTDGDGVRDLYVGSLAHLSQAAFPDDIDYLALGHLHVAQSVGSANHIRYSGSPIAMGFGEAKQQKYVLVVDFDAQNIPHIQELSVPCFRPLMRISGDLDAITTQLETLKHQQSDAWLEVEYTGHNMVPNLNEQIRNLVQDTPMQLCLIKNKQMRTASLNQSQTDESLWELSPHTVFLRRLALEEDLPDVEKETLIACHHEIVHSIFEEDKNAE